MPDEKYFKELLTKKASGYVKEKESKGFEYDAFKDGATFGYQQKIDDEAQQAIEELVNKKIDGVYNQAIDDAVKAKCNNCLQSCKYSHCFENEWLQRLKKGA